MSDDKWEKLCRDINKAHANLNRDRGEIEHKKLMDKMIEDAQMQTMDYLDKVKVDMINEPYSGPLQYNTSGYVQEVHQAHLDAHKFMLEESNRQGERLLLSAMLDELVEIRKLLARANKPKRKKK